MTALFCFGLGYVARHVANAPSVQSGFDHIYGTSRSASHNVFIYQGDGVLDDEALAALAQATHILVSIPPDAHGCPVARHIRALCADTNHMQWVGYLSTTGVYGDTHGAWVDEESPLQPTSPQAAQRVLAEQQWLDWGRVQNVPVQIFRLSGIYGPGRSAFERIITQDTPLIHAPDHVFNRIHVDDIVHVLHNSMYHSTDQAIYNVADDLPAAQEEVMRFAYMLLKRPVPDAIPLAQAQLSPMAQTFYRDNKRVCNEKIKRDLGVMLRYPTYQDGLRAIFESCYRLMPANDTWPSA